MVLTGECFIPIVLCGILMRLLPQFLSCFGEAMFFCYFSIAGKGEEQAVHVSSNLHDVSKCRLSYCLLPIDSASATTAHVLFHESPCFALSIHLHSSSSPVIFLYPFPISSTNPEEGSVLLSGSKLCFFLQVAPQSPAALLSGFHFIFSWRPICRQNCAYLQRQIWESPGKEAGSWGKDSNMQVWDTGQSSSLLVKYIKIQNSPSQTSAAWCQPQQRCQGTPQPWRLSSLQPPLCIPSAVGWHWAIETCPHSICSVQNSHQPST